MEVALTDIHSSSACCPTRQLITACQVLPSREVRGFTLIEILLVLLIMGISTAMFIPSIAALGSADKFNSALSGISDTLMLAREKAISSNTYVWVAFADPVMPNDSLAALVIASADGTNPIDGWASSTIVIENNPDFRVVGKQQNYARCQITDAGSFNSTDVSSLPKVNVDSAINSLASTVSFSFHSRIYTRVIQFTPSGLACNGINPVNLVEFGVKPSSGSKNNVAVLRVQGITGQTTLYRP